MNRNQVDAALRGMSLGFLVYFTVTMVPFMTVPEMFVAACITAVPYAIAEGIEFWHWGRGDHG